MHFSILIALGFTGAASAAAAPRFYRDASTPGSPFTVEASTCDEAGKIYSALEQWKARLGESVPSTPPPPFQKTASGCIVSLENAAPEFVKKYDGVKVVENWGNCWGTVLAAAGMVPDFIDTHSMEEGTQLWVDSPLCSPVPQSQKPQPGDLISIGTPLSSSMLRHTHGMVYVGEGLVFSKNDGSTATPFAVQSMDDVLKVYPVENSPSCRQANPKNYGKCSTVMTYYRCTTMNQLTQNPAHPISANLSACFAKMGELENRVRARSLKADQNSFDEVLSQIRGSAEAIQDFGNQESGKIKEQMKSKSLSQDELSRLREEAFLWDTLGFRAQAIWGGI